MISRTKVNYKLQALFHALFIAEKATHHKLKLVSMLQDYLGVKHVLLTPSGRASLYFILKAIDHPRVVIPAYTCNAVVEAVKLAGKEVVFVEVESNGFNMSVTALEEVVDDTSAVVATHQFGIPCDIERIVDLCRERGALVIEDAAASFGTRVRGKLTGTFGDIAFFSFDSTKLVNVPMKGGFITAKSAAVFDRIRSIYFSEIRPVPFFLKLKWLTQSSVLIALENHILYRIFHKLLFELCGKATAETAVLASRVGEFYRYDMANWQAYIAVKQLAQIDKIIKQRQLMYSQYIEKLGDCQAFELPPPDIRSEWACIRFPIRVRGNKFAYYWTAAKQGVDFAFSFTFLVCPTSFSKSRALANSVLDIPFYLNLSTYELNQVIYVLRNLDSENYSDVK
jgi:dTDP-4-amino-4,6-dideoxygalactose transaminase